jgi:MFS family permease
VTDLDELASVETAYAPRFNSNGASPYTVGQATEILTYIASNVRSRGMRDFAWWDIPAWEGVHVIGPALAPNNPRQQLREILRGGIRIACYVPLVLVAFCVIFLIFGESWRTSLIAVGVLAGSIVVTGIISGLVLVVSELFNRPWRLEDSVGHTGPGDIWRRERRQTAVRSLRRGVVGGVIGLAAGALFTGSAEDPTLRLAYGLLYGVMLAFAVALSSRLKGVLSIRVSGVFLTVAVVVGVCLFAIGSSVVFFAGLSVAIEQTPVSPWVWISALVSLTIGWLVAGLATGPAAPHVALGAVSRKLSMTRMTPHPLMAFLIDAHDKGLLRSVGPLYQFRHATLQDRLARGRLTPFSWHIRR